MRSLCLRRFSASCRVRDRETDIPRCPSTTAWGRRWRHFTTGFGGGDKFVGRVGGLWWVKLFRFFSGLIAIGCGTESLCVISLVNLKLFYCAFCDHASVVILGLDPSIHDAVPLAVRCARCANVRFAFRSASLHKQYSTVWGTCPFPAWPAHHGPSGQARG